MALVRSGMDCDAVCTERLAVAGHVLNAGAVFSAGVTESGYFVYINTEVGHCF